MPTTKQVVHLLHTLDPGGCEYMLLLLLPALQRQGWKITVITLGPAGPLSTEFRKQGIEIKSNLFRFIGDPAGLWRLKKAMKEKKPDLIIAHLFYADLLVRLLPQSFFEAPAIPLVHSTYQVPRLWKIRLFERLTAWTLKHCLLVSPAVKTTALRYGLREKAARVIPNPVDVEIFHPIIPEEKRLLREHNSYSADAFLITCVANFIDYKRHTDLLEAFSLIAEQFPSLQLILIGKGPEEPHLRQFVHLHHLEARVHFVGNYLGDRKRVAETVQMSDLFILPSLFEGMCTAIMEAMAAGIPVIASDIPENRVLIPDQTFGKLVEVRNPQALAKAITTLLQFPLEREHIGKQGRERMLNQYSLPPIIAQWETLYTQLVDPQ